MRIQLGIDALDMRPDRIFADEQDLCDIVVAFPLADEPEDLEFGRGELVESLLLEISADDRNNPVHDAAHLVPGEPNFPLIDDPDGL